MKLSRHGFLGRASSASVFFDRLLDEDFAAGVGFGGGSISTVRAGGSPRQPSG
jgi:hypothetical protein